MAAAGCPRLLIRAVLGVVSNARAATSLWATSSEEEHFSYKEDVRGSSPPVAYQNPEPS